MRKHSLNYCWNKKENLSLVKTKGQYIMNYCQSENLSLVKSWGKKTTVNILWITVKVDCEYTVEIMCRITEIRKENSSLVKFWGKDERWILYNFLSKLRALISLFKYFSSLKSFDFNLIDNLNFKEAEIQYSVDETLTQKRIS